jgi:hypothetical protein
MGAKIAKKKPAGAGPSYQTGWAEVLLYFGVIGYIGKKSPIRNGWDLL